MSEKNEQAMCLTLLFLSNHVCSKWTQKLEISLLKIKTAIKTYISLSFYLYLLTKKVNYHMQYHVPHV